MAYKQLKENIAAWCDIGANSEVLCWIEHGVKLNFSSEPCGYEHTNRVKPGHESSFVDTEIAKLSILGVVLHHITLLWHA